MMKFANRIQFYLCLRTSDSLTQVLAEEISRAPLVVPSPRNTGVPLVVLDALCPARPYLDATGVDDDVNTEEEFGCSAELGVDCAATDNCAICLDVLEASQRVRVLPCAHIFHDACLTSWICTVNRCPLCNGAPMNFEEERASTVLLYDASDNDEDDNSEMSEPELVTAVTVSASSSRHKRLRKMRNTVLRLRAPALRILRGKRQHAPWRRGVQEHSLL